jgi:anti-sigma-K factor RskA
MTDHDPSRTDTDERDVAAAEIAVGLRSAPPGLRESDEVLAWQARLSPLLADVVSVAPPAHVWSAIVARLNTAAPRAASGRGDIARSLTFWRALAVGSMGLAAASLVVIVGSLNLSNRMTQRPLVAILGPSNVSALFTAVYDERNSAVTLAPIAGAVQGAQVPELWYVPAGQAPRSLGVFDPTQAVKINLPPAISIAFKPQDALAISLEPVGGSPTGSPTGPIIAQGLIRPL